MMTPEVSVVMAVFNGERYLPLAIESVLHQDHDAFELVILDDASTDATADIIRRYNDPRIVYLRNESNEGQTRSLNIALAAARGAFIARIDADDVYLPRKLRKQHDFMLASPNIVACGTWAIRIDAEGHPIGMNATPTRRADILFRILHGVPLCHVSVMMKRDAIMRHGGYDTRYRYAADFDLWSRLIRANCVLANLPEPLMQYREFPSSIGALHKLGAAGEESAEIIQANARDLVGVDLSREECRDIALLYIPGSCLGLRRICKAHANLKGLAKRSYGGIPARVSVELRGMLFWSLVRARLSQPRGTRGESAPDGGWPVVAELFRHPGVLVIAACSWTFAMMGEQRTVRLKEAVMRQIAR